VDWHNSYLLGGDVAAEVAKLKQEPGNELQVHGSGALAQTLIDHDLIDEYRLLFFPVHLGSGKKLFRDGARAAALRLTGATTTSTGVIIATYEPAGPVRHGSYAIDEP
jgi:dihydrofolate reductase